MLHCYSSQLHSSVVRRLLHPMVLTVKSHYNEYFLGKAELSRRDQSPCHHPLRTLARAPWPRQQLEQPRLQPRGGSGELAGVRQELLQSLRLLEGDLGDGGHGEQVLHAIDDAVRDRGDGGVVDGQTDGSNIGDSGHELLLDVIISDVQDLGVEDGAVVVHLLDEEAVGEGRNLQHVEKGGLGGTNLVTNFDDWNVLDDLNCSLGNLGWDLQSLEERSLLRTHSSVLSWDGHIHGSNGSGLGGGRLLVGQKEIPDGDEFLLGEDKPDVHLDVRQQPLKVWVLLHVATDGLPHHGVLAHQDHGLPSQGNPDLLHLLGANIVGTHDEALGVLLEQVLELGEVVSFPGGSVLPNHLDSKLRNLRTLL